MSERRAKIMEKMRQSVRQVKSDRYRSEGGPSTANIPPEHLEDYKKHRAFLDSYNSNMAAGLSGMTWGATDFVSDFGHGITDYAGQKLGIGDSEFDADMTLMDFVRRERKDRQDRRDAAGGSAVAMELLGSGATGILAGPKLLNQTKRAPRMAAASGYGAAESGASHAFDTGFEDTPTSALSAGIGGVLGLAGQGAGELVEGLSKYYLGSTRDAQRKAADSLTQPGGEAVRYDSEYAAKELLDAARSAGPGRMVADADPNLMGQLAGRANHPHSASVAEPTIAEASKRVAELPKRMGRRVLNFFSPVATPENLAAADKRIDKRLKTGRTAFKELFDTPRGRETGVATRESILSLVDDFADRADGPSAKAVWKKARKIIEAVDGGGDVLSARDLQTVQLEVDNAIRKMNDVGSVDKFKKQKLEDFSKALKTEMEEVIPGYKRAAGTFGSAKEIEELQELGRNFMRNTDEFDTSRIRAKYKEIGQQKDGARKQIEVRKGVTQWLLSAIERGEPGIVAKLTSDESNQLKARLRTIYPEMSGQQYNKFVSEIEEMAEQYKTAKEIMATRRRRQRKVESGDEISLVEKGFGTVAIGTQMAARNPITPGTMHAGRRMVKGSSAPSDRLLVEFLQQQDPAKAEQMLQSILFAQALPRTSPFAGVTGSILGDSISD